MQRFRATVKHDGSNVVDLPWLGEFWAVRHEDAQAEISRLTAELRDARKAHDQIIGERYNNLVRAEKAEAERDQAKGILQSCIKGNIALRDKTQIALAQAAAAVVDMRERAAAWHDKRVKEMKLQIKENNAYLAREGLKNSQANDYCRDSILGSKIAAKAIRALPIDPDAQKALDKLLAKAREDAIRDVEMPGSFISTWHKVTEWCEKEGETVSAQTAWGEVKQAILALLNDGGRDE